MGRAMVRFENGKIPLEELVVFNSGSNRDGYWEHRLPPATYQRHLSLVDLAMARTGVELEITPGWNGERPLHVQFAAQRAFGLGAATPGTSSHGGTWAGRVTGFVTVDTAAIDYFNGPEAFGSQEQFADACREVGMLPEQIMTPDFARDEPWHVIDLDPWSGPSLARIISQQQSKKEDDMKAIKKLGVANSGIIIQAGIPPYSLPDQIFDALCGAYDLRPRVLEDWHYETALREQWTAISMATQFSAVEQDDVMQKHATDARGTMRDIAPNAFEVLEDGAGRLFPDA